MPAPSGRWLLALLLNAACAGSGGKNPQPASEIANPSGSCSAPDTGSREGYHAADGSTWLPDCNSPLNREYWRVFAESADSAYVIPRPDDEVAAICADPQHSLHGLLRDYGLCDAAGAELVERINRLRPEDALALTHDLHTTLMFEALKTNGQTTGVAPYPLPSDIVDACALEPSANSAEFEALCQRERERLESGQAIGFSYDGPGADELVTRLNELYGVR
jgi:hypothetical protein